VKRTCFSDIVFAMTAKNNARLIIRVQPKASRNALSFDENGRIRVSLTAPPVDGEANKALVEYLAERLGLAKRDIKVVGGKASREKRIEIQGLTKDEVEERLQIKTGTSGLRPAKGIA